MSSSHDGYNQPGELAGGSKSTLEIPDSASGSRIANNSVRGMQPNEASVLLRVLTEKDKRRYYRKVCHRFPKS